MAASRAGGSFDSGKTCPKSTDIFTPNVASRNSLSRPAVLPGQREALRAGTDTLCCGSKCLEVSQSSSSALICILLQFANYDRRFASRELSSEMTQRS